MAYSIRSQASYASNDSESNPVIYTQEYISWRRLHLAKSKLANVAEMASFMAGFAVVATVELQINDQDANPTLLTCFVVTTALLVATSMIAIMISTCVLPYMQAVAKMGNIFEVGHSPHETMAKLIDLSWVLGNTASLFFFTLDMILMCWIKFTLFSKGASIAATVIMAPVLIIILIFGILFYRKVMKHQIILSTMKIEELERQREEIHRQVAEAGMSNPAFQPNDIITEDDENIDTVSLGKPVSRSSTETSFQQAARRRGSIFIA